MSDMNVEEKKRFDKMEDVIEKIEKDINEIKTAFLGNSMSGDKGFKGQIEILNVEQKLLKEEVKMLREERVENRVYILIIKGLFVMLASGIVAYIFKKF
jgi:hypothetical protein